MLAPGAVEIDDGLITWVGDPWQVPPAPGTEVRELGGLLMPGLVNCHGHSPMTLVRSAGDGLPARPLAARGGLAPRGPADDEDVYWGMVLGAAELLVQRRHDHLRAVPPPRRRRRGRAGLGHPRPCYTPGHLRRAEPGTRGHLGGTAGGGVPPVRRRWRAGRGGCTSASARTPPTPCRPRGCAAIAAEAQRRDALLQIHLSETVAECELVRERYGMSAPALLASRGRARRPGAGRPLRLARRRRPRPRWPSTTWRWRTARAPTGSSGPGVAPLPALLDRGVRVGLGHRRPGLERRPAPVGRDAPGRPPGPGHGGGPGRR